MHPATGNNLQFMRPYIYPLLALAGLLAGLRPNRAAAQPTAFGFEYRPLAKIVQGADTLALPWAGGLNGGQFSNIDLNADGRPDLFSYERPTQRIMTYLDAPAPGGGRRWVYAPDYETLFPGPLYGYALLRDYDCDGRADLFTRGDNGEILVYRNVAGPSGRPRFVALPGAVQWMFLAGQPATWQTDNILTGTDNVPALTDVNNNGRLDVVTWTSYASGTMELYLNLGSGACGGLSRFERPSFGAWGNIQYCDSSCTGFNNGPAFRACRTVARTAHTAGHGLQLLDLNGDGRPDVLDGRDNCGQMTALFNQGTAVAPVFNSQFASSSWPTAAAPAQANVFAYASAVDANFDGRPDLVVAPNASDNLTDRISLRDEMRLVPNTSATPGQYFGPAGPFLQQQMLDVSEAAAPAFGDLDGDGLLDMLVGNHADNVNGLYRAALAYYCNVGTRTRPVFRLVTADYLGLAGTRVGSNQFVGLKPVLVDLNRDGALDLTYSVVDQTTNRIYFILNTAGPGQPAAFNPATAVYLKGRGAAGTGILPYYKNDAPCFTDVDQDGFVDLLIGTDEVREPGGPLRYFRNLGLARIDTSFALVNANFGQLGGTNIGASRLLAPVVADFDGDRRPDLLTVESTGTLRFMSDYRGQQGLFPALTQAIYNPTTGTNEELHLGGRLINSKLRFAPAAADLDGDGAPELYIGTEGGGVVSYSTRNRLLPTARAAAALALALYPNPAEALTTVETAAATRLTLLDLTGRVLRRPAALATRHQLNVSGLAPGLYLVRATAADGTTAVQRLEVGQR